MFLQVSRATSAFSECLFERVSSRVNDTLSSSWIAIENAWRFLRCVSVGVLFVLVKTISVYGGNSRGHRRSIPNLEPCMGWRSHVSDRMQRLPKFPERLQRYPITARLTA